MIWREKAAKFPDFDLFFQNSSWSLFNNRMSSKFGKMQILLFSDLFLDSMHESHLNSHSLMCFLNVSLTPTVGWRRLCGHEEGRPRERVCRGPPQAAGHSQVRFSISGHSFRLIQSCPKQWRVPVSVGCCRWAWDKRLCAETLGWEPSTWTRSEGAGQSSINASTGTNRDGDARGKKNQVCNKCLFHVQEILCFDRTF